MQLRLLRIGHGGEISQAAHIPAYRQIGAAFGRCIGAAQSLELCFALKKAAQRVFYILLRGQHLVLVGHHGLLEGDVLHLDLA